MKLVLSAIAILSLWTGVAEACEALGANAANQEILHPLYAHAQKQLFVKVPILVFEIPADLSTLPAAFIKQLGLLDGVLSPEATSEQIAEYCKDKKYFMLNYVTKDGETKPDFYPISEKSFGDSYVEIPGELLRDGNPVLFERVIDSGMFDPAKNYGAQFKLMAMQKVGTVEMIRTNSLRDKDGKVLYPDEQELRVKGGLKNPEFVTIKPAGLPGYLSLNGRGAIYLINSESSGNPAGHLPAN